MNFNLCLIRPRGFLHSSAFLEVRDSLAWSLTALGHDVMLTENAWSASRATNIIFGCELLAPGTKLPPDSVIYNFEQPTHPRFPGVQKLAADNDAIVWDYSLRNLKLWHDVSMFPVHVPVGYTPNLTRIPRAPTQDWDVCFFGWLTARRIKVINDLRAAGLNVYASDSCYGGARDNIISRSKVCLNVHHDGRDMFEIVRVSYLLANSKCVISEVSSDDEDYSYLRYGLLRTDYEGTADYIRSFLAQGDPKGISTYGYEEFTAQDYTATIRRAIRESDLRGGDVPEGPIRPTTVAPPSKGGDAHDSARSGNATPGGAPSPDVQERVRTRYLNAQVDGDMKDFMAWLRKHAKGQILEIGTRDGASTAAFLYGLSGLLWNIKGSDSELIPRQGHLTSIDITDCSSLFPGHPQWTFIHGSSHNGCVPPGPYDLALIDGDHSRPGVRADLELCYSLVRPGGLILVHDISPEPGHEWYAVGIRDEYLKFAARYGLEHEELPGKYGMGVITR